MNAPQSTVEKPLTAIDYIAILPDCRDMTTLTRFIKQMPEETVMDERFARAFVGRVLELVRQ